MKYVNLTILALILLGYVLILPPSQSAQTEMSGTWATNENNWKQNRQNKNDDDEWDKNEILKSDIQLNFRYQTRNGKSNNGRGYTYNELQGLTKEQVNDSNAQVKFQIVREAGVIECEGIFNRGKGAGNWRFTANKAFSEAMQNRGFSFDNEDLFNAATLELTVAFVDDIRSAGFKNLETEDLFKAKIFKIDSSFMKEMTATGFPNLEMEDLVKARIFKINADFVKEVTKMGFAKDSMEELVKLRIFKITPAYLQEMKDAGLKDLSIEEAVKLRIFKIDNNFIQSAKNKGYKDLDVEELVKMKIFGQIK